MQVSFTKADSKRYMVTITRRIGPPLVPRFAPGYDDLMPHDLAHYLVEDYYKIELGVWGQLAAGGTGIFTPAPEHNSLRHQRRAKRIATVGRKDMARSERLVVVTMASWEREVGRTRHQDLAVTIEMEPDTLAGAVERVATVAEQWAALALGDSLAFTWPAELTFHDGRSRRGRRSRKA